MSHPAKPSHTPLFFFVILLQLFAPVAAQALTHTTRAIYAPAQVSTTLPSHSTINALFLPANHPDIPDLKAKNFKIFTSVNIFGSTGPWRDQPDTRPITADGSPLSADGHGGICPTHPQWRQGRLNHIDQLLQLPPQHRPDGIWLDFIRYPGTWETATPGLPDTCYCPRCLTQFQQDSGLTLPAVSAPAQAAQWISAHAAFAWMSWKKEQINSLVRDIRTRINTLAPESRPLLGLFLVPWQKGEYKNALSYHLAQDPFLLSKSADVLSPMLYHGMTGNETAWVTRMLNYYQETALCPVWPIVQGVDVGDVEFEEVVTAAMQGDADGLLVYAPRGMGPMQLEGLADFQARRNLLINPEFSIDPGETLPLGWTPRRLKHQPFIKEAHQVRDSATLGRGGAPNIPPEAAEKTDHDTIWPVSGTNALGLVGQAGLWRTMLDPCLPGRSYRFSGELLREHWDNYIYPQIGFMGSHFRVINHWREGVFQPIRLEATCPQPSLKRKVRAQTNSFYFHNRHEGETFWLRNPRLTLLPEHEVEKHRATPQTPPPFFSDIFPIGAYGIPVDELATVRELGLNTVILSGRGDPLRRVIQQCQVLGLRYMLSVPRDPDQLRTYLDDLEDLIDPSEVAFYVNDEPGIHSFPINRADDINRLLKSYYPDAPTTMAVVRPQVTGDYLAAADYFMLDQYPVPHSPMIWLSDSMDQAAKFAGEQRLASVIQAFGGPAWAEYGWSRMPTLAEMNNLTFLSLLHGSRAVFFFTYAELGKTPQGRQDLATIAQRVQQISPWLINNSLREPVPVTMTSNFKLDPQGNNAVQCRRLEQQGHPLLLCVNTISATVRAEITPTAQPTPGQIWQDLYSETDHPVTNTIFSARFKPYEVKALTPK